MLFEAHCLLCFFALLGGLLGASWAILAPKRVPNGAQKGAQSVKKVVSSGLLLLVLFLELFFDEKYVFFIYFFSYVFHALFRRWKRETREPNGQKTSKFVVGSLRKQGRASFLNRVNACRNLEFLVNKWSKKQRKSHSDLS